MRALRWVACLGASLLLSSSASASTIEVTTTGDELAVDGDCSLREAVQSANENVSFDDCAKGQGDSRD
ncbi:MAG: CSLREA domain-containing protein, partial [Actinomycetota bacterium]|nr:CSLREA domain-containing protein [Actinomycetota bacterium]